MSYLLVGIIILFSIAFLVIVGFNLVLFVLNVIGGIFSLAISLIEFIWNRAIALMDWILSSWVAFSIGVIGIILILL